MSAIIELRVTSAGDLDRCRVQGVDLISLGQEGCAVKAPGREDVEHLARLAREDGRRSGLVVPMAWPRSEQWTREVVTHAIQAGIDEVVVNDWGTILAVPDRGRVVVGLGLTRGVPMSGTEPVRPSLDSSIEQLVAELGLAGAEVDAITSVEPGSPGIRRHTGPVAAGWSRSCPTLRARAPMEVAGECAHWCDSPLRLRASTRWRLIDGKREVLPAGTRAPEVTVWGNAVYLPALAAGAPAHTPPEHVVIDMRHVRLDVDLAVRSARAALTGTRTPHEPAPQEAPRAEHRHHQ